MRSGSRPRGAGCAGVLICFSLCLPGSVALAQTRVRAGFNLFSPQQDVEIGRQSVIAVERQWPLLRDALAVQPLTRLGQTLAAQAPGERFPYTFRVLNVAAVNAFALPGGTIYLNRGLLEATQTEAELAGVLAHEIAHVALRHGTSQISKACLARAGLGVLGGVTDQNAAGQIIAATGGFGLNPVLVKYSPEDETQADVLAAQMMARAGYDPRELVLFLETLRLSGNELSGPVAFFSDHPVFNGRSERIEREAAQLRVQSVVRQHSGFSQLQRYLAGLPRPGLNDIPRRSAVAAVSIAPGGISVASVRIDKPSTRYRTFSPPGGLYQIAYPDNWEAHSGSDKFGVLLAPPGAVVHSGGVPQLVYGAIINHYSPIGDNSEYSGRPRRGLRYVGGRGPLVEATNDLLNSLLQNNPYLGFVRASDRRSQVGAPQVITFTLNGRSPVTGRAERVQLYTSLLNDDHIIYALFVAPEEDYDECRHAFNQMLRSLRIDDDELKRH